MLFQNQPQHSEFPLGILYWQCQTLIDTRQVKLQEFIMVKTMLIAFLHSNNRNWSERNREFHLTPGKENQNILFILAVKSFWVPWSSSSLFFFSKLFSRMLYLSMNRWRGVCRFHCPQAVTLLDLNHVCSLSLVKLLGYFSTCDPRNVIKNVIATLERKQKLYKPLIFYFI